MENIPAQIKELLKTDGTLKNLRIVFEDESYPDICNDRIVRESMKFEESLSSREQLKYGLCENSTLSFECVDFGDVKDKFIRAYIEVDGTSLYGEKYVPADGKPYIAVKNSEYYFIITKYRGQAEQMNDGTGVYVENGNTNVDKICNVDTAYFEEETGISLNLQPYSGAILMGMNVYVYSVMTDSFYEAILASARGEDVSHCDFTIQRTATTSPDLHEIFAGACYLNGIYYVDPPIDVPLAIPEVLGGKAGAIFPYYPIPFGRYKIDECKLDVSKGLRKIRAYTVMPDFYHASPGNKLLTDCFFAPGTTIHFDPMNFFITNNSDKFNLNITYTDYSLNTETKTVNVLGNTTYYATFYITMAAFGGDIGVSGWSNDMVYVGKNPTYNTSAETALTAWYEAVKSNFPSAKQAELMAQIALILNNHFRMSTAVVGTREDPNVRKYEADLDEYTINVGAHSYIVTHVNVTLYNNQTALDSVDIDVYPTSELTVKIANKGFIMVYDLTAAKENLLTPAGYTVHEYSFYEYLMSIDPRELLENIMELRAWFGGIDRTGRFKPYAIDVWEDGLFPTEDLFPADDLYPEEWESEGDVDFVEVESDDTISLAQEPAPIYFGAVSCKYLSSEHLDDNDNPMELLYYNEWDSTGLVYEVEGNEIIDQNTYTDAAITGSMSRLVAALKKLKYYQSTAEIIGLPYMEAGDYAVISLRETALPVLVLDRKLSGIQAMRDKITA